MSIEPTQIVNPACANTKLLVAWMVFLQHPYDNVFFILESGFCYQGSVVAAFSEIVMSPTYCQYLSLAC